MIMTMIVNSILSKMTRSLPTCLMGEHAGHIDKQRRRQHEGKRLPFPATQASGNWKSMTINIGHPPTEGSE